MADMKIPGSLPTIPARPMSGARAEAIRNAQKAFFQAAMPEAHRAPPEPKPSAKPQQSAAPTATPATNEPQRYLRPGSRLDIKV
jgi:hypothetical protein